MNLRVAIIYKYIPQYRRCFFELLKERISQMGMELILICGQPGAADSKKKDTANLEWAKYIPSKIFKVAQTEFYWQPILSAIKDVDLVIVEQANKLLVNHILLLENVIGIRKLAYWGHGRNFQATSSNQFSESLKCILATKVHWWFAYNEMSARVVRERGFPTERITLVQNAVDTNLLIRSLRDLTPVDTEKIRQELNICSRNIGIYVGGLYPEKRIPFLLEALSLIRQQVSDFEMIFVGGGVDEHLVIKAAARNSWIHHVDPKFGQQKVPYYAVSKLFLMPGLIGLGI